MDKVTKFLERYVEWLALVLGAAFLGYCVWFFILNKPVTSQVGSAQNVSPGDVDPLVWDGPGQQLQTQIASREQAPAMGPTTDYEQFAKDQFNKTSPAVASTFPKRYLPLVPAEGSAIEPYKSPVAPSSTRVTQLPTAPVLTGLQVSQGHSNVPAPQPAAGGNNPQPNVQQAAAVDKNWVSVEATIPTEALAKAYNACKIPGVFRNSTAILRVEMKRQERDGSGNWGPETDVPALEINPLEPLPADNSSALDQSNYYQWAEKNVALIAAPPFYNVLQGDVWYEPGTKNPNQTDLTVIDDGFDPKNPGAFKGDPSKLTPEDRKIYDEYQAQHKPKPRPQPRPNNNYNRNGPNPGGMPGFVPGGMGPGGRSPAVPDPERNRGTPNLGGMPYPGGGPPMPGGMPYPGMMQPPTQSGPVTNTTLPQGSFDPSNQGNIKVWQHDATVQPGKTYRYKMRYILHNPVAQTVGLCVPQDLATHFYLTNEYTAWTAPVNVESDTNFYAVDAKHGIRIDIFKWKNGTYQMQTVQVNPGDEIGTMDTTTNTDFTTHWTLVDVREDPSNESNRTIVLVSDNGTVLKKELNIDSRSIQYRNLLDQVNANKEKTASAQPGQPPQPPGE